MHIFYTPHIEGNLVKLDEKESRHSVKVLRIKQGSRVYLVDGQGGFYEGAVVDADPKGCAVKVEQKYDDFEQRSYFLHLAVAPTKQIDRFEWMLEKAVEIGVDEITPFTGFHSERRKLKYERLERIIISAMKQSLKAYKPRLNPLVTFQEMLEKAREEYRFIPHCRNFERQKMNNLYVAGKSVFIAIGPEGDFSEQEVATALERNFQSVSLGSSRLRTETAGVAACHTVYLANQ